jgi:hypothetical protein
MRLGGFLRGLLLIGVATAGPTACFTEVGNPDGETAMTASLRVDYSAPDSSEYAGPDSVLLSTFTLRLLGANYRDDDSVEHALRGSRTGSDLNFAGEAVLPRAVLTHAPPRSVELRLGISPLTGSVQGAYWHGGTRRDFRFLIPDTTAVFLRYDSTALEAWRTNGDYDCRFTFLARRWLAISGLDTAVASPDGADSYRVILDAEHNADLYRVLVQEFVGAFNSVHAYPKKSQGH